MGPTKETAFESFPHSLRTQIKSTYKFSEVYEKMGINPNKTGELIQSYYDWKTISKVFPNKFSKFFNMPLSVDDKIRLGAKVENLNTIYYGDHGINELTVLTEGIEDKTFHFVHHEDDTWNGELYIDDFSIKNPLHVQVMKIFNEQGVVFYWEEYSWASQEEEYAQNDNEEDWVFPPALYHKYEAIAEEWKHVLRNTKLDISIIEKHLRKSNISDDDRVWYSLVLYIFNGPILQEFQTPEEDSVYIAKMFKIIPKHESYAEAWKMFTYDYHMNYGFAFKMTLYKAEIRESTLEYYPYNFPTVYSLLFNRAYWYTNYANEPYYANQIQKLLSSKASYYRLSKSVNWSELYGALTSVQRKIYRFYNFIKRRNQKHNERNRI